MEIRVVDKTANTIEIELPGQTDTLLNLLKSRLLADDKVVSATYLLGHPQLDAPRLYVEVSDGKPDAHLRTAAKELRQALDEFETKFVKALGQA